MDNSEQPKTVETKRYDITAEMPTLVMPLPEAETPDGHQTSSPKDKLNDHDRRTQKAALAVIASTSVLVGLLFLVAFLRPETPANNKDEDKAEESKSAEDNEPKEDNEQPSLLERLEDGSQKTAEEIGNGGEEVLDFVESNSGILGEIPEESENLLNSLESESSEFFEDLF